MKMKLKITMKIELKKTNRGPKLPLKIQKTKTKFE